ncbi:MAG: hypothetical protein EP323_06795 [Gammaproteobacteria bacterium]|nr:MAG: hypothetical protein EP323_06795 [Gammaproteobacteria bacterium]
MNYQGSHLGFSQLLDAWEKRSAENSDLLPTSITIHEPDQIKLQALAEMYQLPADEIAAHLLSIALETLEAEMPYVPGTKVIRIEEGNEIFEDIGPMPRYLEIQRQLREKLGK